MVIMNPAEKEQLLRSNLKWHGNAKIEFRNISRALQIEVSELLVKAITVPDFGEELEDKHGMDLSGCIKIYFDNYKRRIVYQITPEGMIYIWGIGWRNELAVYRDVYARMADRDEDQA